MKKWCLGSLIRRNRSREWWLHHLLFQLLRPALPAHHDRVLGIRSPYELRITYLGKWGFFTIVPMYTCTYSTPRDDLKPVFGPHWLASPLVAGTCGDLPMGTCGPCSRPAPIQISFSPPLGHHPSCLVRPEVVSGCTCTAAPYHAVRCEHGNICTLLPGIRPHPASQLRHHHHHSLESATLKTSIPDHIHRESGF